MHDRLKGVRPRWWAVVLPQWVVHPSSPPSPSCASLVLAHSWDGLGLMGREKALEKLSPEGKANFPWRQLLKVGWGGENILATCWWRHCWGIGDTTDSLLVTWATKIFEWFSNGGPGAPNYQPTIEGGTWLSIIPVNHILPKPTILNKRNQLQRGKNNSKSLDSLDTCNGWPPFCPPTLIAWLLRGPGWYWRGLKIIILTFQM